MKIKFVVAHIHSIDVKKAKAKVSVLSSKDGVLYWTDYNTATDELVVFDTRNDTDNYIKSVFGNDVRYISYGIRR